jgi:putative DNA primase/helicase
MLQSPTTSEAESGAKQIVRALGGTWLGDYGMVRCPAHRDRTPSLSVRHYRGKVVFHCFAGCPQSEVVEGLRTKGLLQAAGCDFFAMLTTERVGPANLSQDTKRTQTALRIWSESEPAVGTPVRTYLLARGINMPIPDSLRFHPALRHGPSGETWPAMVALVTHSIRSEPVAVHRTFLSRDGKQKAPVNPQKMMLGPCRSGVIRLAAGLGALMVGEGIETCLSALQATRRPTWAALSTSGLSSLDLPYELREVLVLADGDAPGETAAVAAARRWQHEGRQVKVARPPLGIDFNDWLRGAHPSQLEE